MKKSINLKTVLTFIFLSQCILSAKADSFTETKFYGEIANDRFGTSVSDAGDLNGDGFDDIVVGSPNHNNFRGKVYIYFGGNSVSQNPSYIINGEYDGNSFGHSVSSAGDVNQDGFGDLIVGAHGYSDSIQNYGRAYIYLGGSDFDVTADVIITGDPNEELGKVISCAGDVNGDGYSDVIIGCPGYFVSPVFGRANIYFGGANMDNIKDVSLNSMYPSGYANDAAAGVGDLNGDGFSDVVVGAMGIDQGRSYVYYGGITMDNYEDLILYGSVSSVSGTDFNGDGFSDAIVGSWGNAVVFTGGMNMDNNYDFRFRGNYTNENVGWSVSDAGDVNGDHFNDFIVGGPINSEVFIYYGGRYPDTTYDIMKSGESSIDQYGMSVSKAGDVNYDGLEDFVIGAPHSQYTGYLAGSAYLYLSTGPAVRSVYPKQNAVNASKSTDITVVFSQSMNASTINSSNIKTFGLQTGKLSSFVSYNEGTNTATINPSGDFKTGEKILVSLTSGIRTSLDTSITPFTWSFTVKPSGGTGNFELTSSPYAGIGEINSLIPADIDNDSFLDLTVMISYSKVVFLSNNGNMEFPDNSNFINIPGNNNGKSQMLLGDYDSDADLDLALMTYDNANPFTLRIYKNGGSGNFSLFSTIAGVKGAFVMQGDFNGDGNIDLAGGGNFYGLGESQVVYNDGTGNYSTRTNFFTTCGCPYEYLHEWRGMAAEDYDNDGKLDLMLEGVQYDLFHEICECSYLRLYLNTFPEFTPSSELRLLNYTRELTDANDINGDGFMDLILNPNYIYRNNIPDFPIDSFPGNGGQYITCDIDGDGDIDIIEKSNELRILKNNGAGDFALHSTNQTSFGGSGFASADMDQDGDIDIIATSNETGELSIFENDASTNQFASVIPHQNAIAVSKSSDILVLFSTAMNASTINSSNIKVYGSHTGFLNCAISYDAAQKKATINPVSDFKTGEEISVTLKSGILSITGDSVTSLNYKFTVDATQGEGFFSETSIINSEGFSCSGDIDGDGDIDIISHVLTGGFPPFCFKVYKNDGNSSFAETSYFYIGSGYAFLFINIALEDIDSDGDLDVLATTQGLAAMLYVVLNDGSGSFPISGYSYSLSTGIPIEKLLTGDFDNDGDLDIAMNSSPAQIYSNNGSGNFDQYYQIDEFGNAPMTTGDFDNDGRLDLVCYGRFPDGYTKIRAMKNNSNFVFTPVITFDSIYDNGISYNYTAISDNIDNDRYPDIIISGSFGPGSTKTKVFRNNHNGTYSNVQEIVNMYISASGDFNSDNDLDMVLKNSVNVLSLYKNINGLFVFSNEFGNSNSDIDPGDFDGDGDIDIFWNNLLYINYPLIPTAQLTAVPPTGNSSTVFGNTNLTFSGNVSVSAPLTVSSYNTLPAFGVLPAGVASVGNIFWSVENNNGVTFSEGSMSVPLSILNGLNPDSLTWLKRSNPGDNWTNIGGIVESENFVSTVAFDSLSEFAFGITNCSTPICSITGADTIFVGSTNLIYLGSTHDAYWDISNYDITQASILPGQTGDSVKVSAGQNAGHFVLYYVTPVCGTYPSCSKHIYVVNPNAITCTIFSILEGYYNVSMDRLNMRDTVRAYLRNVSAPYDLVDSSIAVIDSVLFGGSFVFTNAPTGTYYIVIRQRNGLETWSESGGIYLTRGGLDYYDFPAVQTQAYGNNLTLKGTRYCIFSGDVNQNGIIDLSDLTLVYNDVSSFASGYVISDLNGDRVADLSDMLIVHDNSSEFVSLKRPQ